MSKLIKEMLDALNAVNQNKTQPYDRQGEVKRIEGKTAWVKLEGSDRETPIQMTIACDVGDTVQARIGGGSAWLTGNLTAPPTDDKKANEAITMVTNVVQEVQEQVEEALEDATDVEDVTMQYCLSDSSSTFVQYGDWSDTPPEYVSGYYYWTRTVIVDDDGNETYGTPQYSQDTQLSVETSRAYATTNAHFWYDNTGAYVTDSTQDDYRSSATGKYATRVTPTGILQSYEGTTLSSWTNSGISFLQGGSTVASFGSGGVSLYASGAQIASFGSTIKLGSPSGRNWEFNGANLYFYQGSTLCGEISSVYGSSNGVAISSQNGLGRLSVSDSVSYLDGQTVNIYALGQLQLQANSSVYIEPPIRSELETPTISITQTSSDVGTRESTTIKRFANVVQLLLKVKNSSSVADGGDIYTATISTTALRPAVSARGSGYYGARAIIGSIGTDGAITIRLSGASLSANTSVHCGFTYLVE